MIYRFGHCELDLAVVELRCNGEVVSIEPQVFRLLVYLVEHRERMVSKDEIIEAVWSGRVVSDSALTSRIKAARKAIGDSGEQQRLIRTVRGQGFRFIAEVQGQEVPVASAQPGQPLTPSTKFSTAFSTKPSTDLAANPSESALAMPVPAVKPSIAVLPFAVVAVDERQVILADALPHELITALARLRWLSVIARTSSFRFRDPAVDILEVGRALKVGYCLTGLVESRAGRLLVSVDLVDTGNRNILWSEVFDFNFSEVHDICSSLVDSVIAALELQIPLHEAGLARLRTSESLDAWAEYHLGLQAMYHFNHRDNAMAEAHFQRALKLDPHFARAHAGVSFTRFQDALLNYSGDVPAAIESARRYAERGYELDPVDPFTNLVLGRAHHLAGDFETGIVWCDRANTLSPSYAQGQYSRGLASAILCRGQDAMESAERAITLSPLDPLLYAMYSSRGLGHLVLGEVEAGLHWAERGALSPGAHVIIVLIALIANGLAGNEPRAWFWARDAKNRRADVTAALLFRSFPFADPAVRERFSKVLTRFGIPTS
ncbi:winged helix-turn-helix domain-containing tetratricopeptide repeat protein [Halioxenophilus sp. WMMB6]|uniref:winged helix-turn-helix domain-containing tetratricopeptide repeat protein n=1 Tax=Halioxenophilus sp. WMMB6 TaxID=3073815 RepID=UPI00295F3B81|nr:winged helix-turn-helix domain-containing protein [Halioxenophilus sp. WMMB6]